MTLQALSRAVRTGHGGHHSFTGPPGVRANSVVCNIHNVLAWTVDSISLSFGFHIYKME